MASYVVCTVDGEKQLIGIVQDLDTGEMRRFVDADTLVAALATFDGPGPEGGGEDPVEEPSDPQSAYLVRIDRNPNRARALTPAQLRICYLAMSGKSNPMIARELCLARSTVESHLHAAYRRLGIDSRTELPTALAA